MECGSTAQTGGLSLLGGLLSADNLIGVLNAVYPTIRGGAVYGPLRQTDLATWNAWVSYVGSTGAFYPELNRLGELSTQGELDDAIEQFVYGSHVVAGRHEPDNATNTMLSGCAGGFVGAMHSGVIRNSHAEDAKLVSAMRAAGGFAGGCYGGQLGRDNDGSAETVWLRGLKQVRGTYCIGGFVGKCSAASVLDANTNDASSGLLQGLLNSLISTPDDLLNLLQATVSTIKFAELSGVNSDWGFVIDGEYRNGDTMDYADCAGGFAGSLEATVLGERNNAEDTLTVSGLRAVKGGYYVGGFFGLADVTSVAEVGAESGSSILSLVNAGNISLLDAFRTYIYHASVTGVDDGIRVSAFKEEAKGVQRQYQVSGGAGGFGGGLMNGTVENSSVSGLNTISAPNYAAGFIAQMGKSGVLDLDEVSVDNDSLLGRLLDFLSIDPTLGAGLFSIVGSTVSHCEASGFPQGFVALTTAIQSPEHNNNMDEAYLTGACAAGFTGFADIAQIEDSHVYNLKYVSGDQIAAGFIGRSSAAYLAELEVDLSLLNQLLTVLSPLIRVLYGLTTLDALDLSAWDALGIRLLADGDLLWLNLFGLQIGLSLMENDPEFGGSTDAITLILGSSVIKLPYDPESGTVASNASVSLIEGNRTCVKNCTVSGVDVGYDVFGGGASQGKDGSGGFGYAGGFVGLNDNGYFSHNRMWLCDVVRGASGLVGPFAGVTRNNSASRPVSYLEGNDNHYSIYRTRNAGLDHVETADGISFGNSMDDSAGGVDFNRYDVLHRDVIHTHGDLENAIQKGSGEEETLDAFISSAQAVLMLNRVQNENPESEALPPDEKKDPCAEHFDLSVHKKWRDYNDMFHTRPTELLIEVYVIDLGTSPRAQLIQCELPESDWNLADLELLDAQHPGFLDATGGRNPIVFVLSANEDESLRWKGTLENLPVAYTVDGEVHYLQYVVTEHVPDQYQVLQYEIMEDTASVIITNELTDVVLPGTGGSGTVYWYVMAEIPLFFGVALFYIIRRRREEENGTG